MKLKYYLRGLGIGIVITGIIMSIASATQRDTLTNVDIITKAQELGMVTQDDYDLVKKDLEDAKTNIDDLQSQLNNTETVQSEQQNIKEENAEKPQTDQSLQDTTTDDVDTTDSNSNNTTTQETNIEDSVSETTTVNFSIVPGMGSESLANLLEQKGAIDSASDFNDYIVNSGNENNLQIGDFQVIAGESYDTIMSKIIGR